MYTYDKETLQKALTELAFKKTTPFCYSCYEKAPTGRCSCCGTDDLMRHLDGVGVEYGTEWVVESLLQENIAEASFSEQFEQHIEDCYGETINVGWMDLCTVTVMKESDPISWDIAKGEYVDALEQDELVVTFDNGSSYFWVDDVVNYLEENNVEVEEAA